MPIQWQDLVRDIREKHVRVPGAKGGGRCLSCQKQWECAAIQAATAVESLALGHEKLIGWAALAGSQRHAYREVLDQAIEISTEALKLRAA